MVANSEDDNFKLPSPLRLVAEEQGGLFTRAQFERMDLRDVSLAQLLLAGELSQVRPSVFRIRERSGPLDEPIAIWLEFKPELMPTERKGADIVGVLSREGAAYAHGLGPVPEGPWTYICPPNVEPSVKGVAVVHDSLRRDEIVYVDGFPVTTPLRTIVDMVKTSADLSDVSTAIIFATGEQPLLDVDELEKALTPFRSKYQVPEGTAILAHLIALELDA